MDPTAVEFEDIPIAPSAAIAASPGERVLSSSEGRGWGEQVVSSSGSFAPTSFDIIAAQVTLLYTATHLAMVIVKDTLSTAQVEEWNQEIESALMKRARLDSDHTHCSPDCRESMEQEDLEQHQQLPQEAVFRDGDGKGDITRLLDSETLPPPSISHGSEGRWNGNHRDHDRTVVLAYQQVNLYSLL